MRHKGRHEVSFECVIQFMVIYGVEHSLKMMRPAALSKACRIPRNGIGDCSEYLQASFQSNLYLGCCWTEVQGLVVNPKRQG